MKAAPFTLQYIYNNIILINNNISFKAHTASFIGIGESPIENLKWEHKSLPLPKVDESGRFLEIWDDKIANIPVRIYKPKSLEGKKSTALVYLHGGGWTIGSVGR